MFLNLFSSTKRLSKFLIARIRIKFGDLYSSEPMRHIQQMFADSRPPGLLAYLAVAPLETVVDAVMSLTDPSPWD